MGDTSISWTDKTWNVLRGCSKVSPGCAHCYAEQIALRFCGPGQPYEGLADRERGRWTGVVRFVPERLADPLRWRKPVMVFANSMSDVFHESVTNEQIAAIFGVMAAAPRHTFQVLTKRAKRMREWFEWVAKHSPPEHGDETSFLIGHLHDEDADALGDRIVVGQPWPLPNVWLGVSTENQETADERIPELLATPAAVRFLSCEPLLGPVDLDKPRCDTCGDETPIVDTVDGDSTVPWCSEHEREGSYGHWLRCEDGIDWVIAGCESGRGARPCDVEWLRSLRDQCKEAGVPFFLKQATPQVEEYETNGPQGTVCRDVITIGSRSRSKLGGVIELPYLDGVQHAEMPPAVSHG